VRYIAHTALDRQGKGAADEHASKGGRRGKKASDRPGGIERKPQESGQAGRL
jgi:hypothetical protein